MMGSVCKNSFNLFCEAAALWIILAVQPMALTGNVSIFIYITNSVIVPSDILCGPYVRYKYPPIMIVNSVLKPINKAIEGKYNDSTFERPIAFFLYSSLFFSKKPSIALSWTNDFITLIPEYDSCAFVVRLASNACIFSPFLLMILFTK